VDAERVSVRATQTTRRVVKLNNLGDLQIHKSLRRAVANRSAGDCVLMAWNYR